MRIFLPYGRLLAALVLGQLPVISACDAGGVEPTMPQPGLATLRADIDVSALCDVVGVTQVQLRARWIGCGELTECDPQAGPIELLGTRVTCPSTEPSVLMKVEIPEPGHYVVEAVSRYTTGEEDTACLRDPQGATPVAVSADALDAGASIAMQWSDDPCPAQ